MKFLDLFDSIGTEENLPNFTELDLIAQMDQLEFETKQAILNPESEIPEISEPPMEISEIKISTPNSPEILDDLTKEKIKSYWKPDEGLNRLFQFRVENKSINNTDFDLICQVGYYSRTFF